MKEQYPLSKQNESLIKKRLATYSSMAATFLSLAPTVDVNAEIQSFDVPVVQQDYLGHEDNIYAINFNPLGVNTSGNSDNNAEVFIRVSGNTASTDFAVILDQNVIGQFDNIRFLGTINTFTTTYAGNTYVNAVPAAAQLNSSYLIGSQPIVVGKGNGEMGFVNFQNGGLSSTSLGNNSVLLYSPGYSSGNWGNVPTGSKFLGVQFQIAGVTHYGWVELNVTSVTDPMSFSVTRFAYEDCPDTPIAAGETVNSQCSSNDIPTLSEWGLITLAILLLSFGTLYIGRREEELIGQGTRGSNVKLGAYWQKPPLVWAIFKKTLLATGGLAAVAGVLSYLVYGTIAAVDIAGTAIAGPLFAYLMHLLWIFEGGKKDEK